MCRKLITSDKVNGYSLYDPRLLCAPLLGCPGATRCERNASYGVNSPYNAWFSALEWSKYALEGPYFILTSLVEVQMTTLTARPPAFDRTNNFSFHASRTPECGDPRKCRLEVQLISGIKKVICLEIR